jgi:hypothetical protein
MGMIPVDTLDSVVLRSAFHRIFDKKGFVNPSKKLTDDLHIYLALIM